MADNAGKLVIGYRWVSENGGQGCAECAALDGREFYDSPQDGQAPARGAPTPPLHPNCRCAIEPITDAEALGDPPTGESRAEREARWRRDYPNFTRNPHFHQGATEFMGVLWRNDERGIMDGPVYGNYGGRNWGEGRSTAREQPPEEEIDPVTGTRSNTKDPIDDMDKLYEAHDNGYTGCESETGVGYDECTCRVDKNLVSGLKELPDDPRKWHSTDELTDKELAYARRYRRLATWAFEGRVEAYESEQKRREQAP
ncbi:MAG: hypothetical protein ACOZHQ_13670 [Thermodesulfobacteriota bacterium]